MSTQCLSFHSFSRVANANGVSTRVRGGDAFVCGEFAIKKGKNR